MNDRPATPAGDQPTGGLPGGTTRRDPRPVAAAPLRPSAAEGWTNVAGYEILGELGRGAMGVVYKARQKNLNRLVALKTIRPAAHGKEGLSRFIAEARVVAQLQHPNIVQIYEVSLQHDLPFFCMELIEGGNLAERLGGRPQSPREAARLLCILAGAVHAAHEKGIVHRDLKPANVLMQRRSDPARSTPELPLGPDTLAGLPLGAFDPKVTDFGLAKQVGAGSDLTQTGMIMGTPNYMAPEQAEGRVRDVGPAADIYALGAILYECLTGRPPFNAESPAATVLLLFNAEPLAPSRLVTRLPRDLETICLKCLRKEPQRRYGSAAELADDLQRFLDSEPIRARPAPLAEQAWKWLRRHPATAAALASGLAGVVALAGVVVFHQVDLRAQLARALAEERQARGDEEEAQQRERLTRLRHEVQDLIHRADDALTREDWAAANLPLTRARDRLLAEPGLDDLRQRLDRLAARSDQQRADRDRLGRFRLLRDRALIDATLFTGSDVRTALADTRRSARAALDCYADPAAMAGPYLSPAERREVVEGCFELLVLLADATARPLPDDDTAERRQRGAAAAAVLAAADRFGLSTRAYHQRRAQYLRQAGDTTAAEREQAAATAVRAETALDHFLLGADDLARGELAAAARAFDAVLQKRPSDFWARYYQALCRYRQGKHDLAAAAFTACLAQRQDLVWPYLLRGAARTELGQFAQAEDDFHAATLRRFDGGALYAWLLHRGVLRVRQKRLAEAESDFKQAIGLRPRRYPGHANLARVYLLGHRLDEAAAQFGQAIHWERRLAGLYRSRARVHLLRGDDAAALADLEAAVRHGVRDAAATRAGDQLARGRLLTRRRDHEAALIACTEAVRLYPTAAGHRQRAEVLLALKRHEEAERDLDASLARAPNDPEVLCARAAVRARLGRYKDAQADYGRALELRPDADVVAARGWTYLVSDAPRLALGDFEEAVRLGPGRGDILAGRALAHAQLNNSRQALADAGAALVAGPESPRLYYNVARVYAHVAARAEPARGPRRFGPDRSDHTRRAVELLGLALDRLPAGDRAEFWRDFVLADPLFRSLQQAPGFQALANRTARPAH